MSSTIGTPVKITASALVKDESSATLAEFIASHDQTEAGMSRDLAAFEKALGSARDSADRSGDSFVVATARVAYTLRASGLLMGSNGKNLAKRVHQSTYAADSSSPAAIVSRAKNGQTMTVLESIALNMGGKSKSSWLGYELLGELLVKHNVPSTDVLYRGAANMISKARAELADVIHADVLDLDALSRVIGGAVEKVRESAQPGAPRLDGAGKTVDGSLKAITGGIDGLAKFTGSYKDADIARIRELAARLTELAKNEAPKVEATTAA
jgi:hypothetical protein